MNSEVIQEMLTEKSCFEMELKYGRQSFYHLT